MLIIVHENEKLIRVESFDSGRHTVLSQYANTTLNCILFDLAQAYKEETIAWCLASMYENVMWQSISSILTAPMQMFSFHPSEENVFHPVMSYSHFFSTTFSPLSKTKRYQTWMMSEAIGLIHASLANKFNALHGKFNFQFTLNAISKIGSTKGILHYSEPALYTGGFKDLKQENHLDSLYFIRLLQGRRWSFYAALLEMYNEGFKFGAFCKPLFRKSYAFKIEEIDGVNLKLVHAITNTNNHWIKN